MKKNNWPRQPTLENDILRLVLERSKLETTNNNQGSSQRRYPVAPQRYPVAPKTVYDDIDSFELPILEEPRKLPTAPTFNQNEIPTFVETPYRNHNRTESFLTQSNPNTQLSPEEKEEFLSYLRKEKNYLAERIKEKEAYIRILKDDIAETDGEFIKATQNLDKDLAKCFQEWLEELEQKLYHKNCELTQLIKDKKYIEDTEERFKLPRFPL